MCRKFIRNFLFEIDHMAAIPMINTRPMNKKTAVKVMTPEELSNNKLDMIRYSNFITVRDLIGGSKAGGDVAVAANQQKRIFVRGFKLEFIKQIVVKNPADLNAAFQIAKMRKENWKRRNTQMNNRINIMNKYYAKYDYEELGYNLKDYDNDYKEEKLNYYDSDYKLYAKKNTAKARKQLRKTDPKSEFKNTGEKKNFQEKMREIRNMMDDRDDEEVTSKSTTSKYISNYKIDQ
ncbi:hypothetical protein C1646_816211 [Rhizophagus diaphanus]|nr:hypothetical protein C1646_816211 [Rhizophagus diaphanus] [Rhizophagus sp. MUCL 43196]